MSFGHLNLIGFFSTDSKPLPSQSPSLSFQDLQLCFMLVQSNYDIQQQLYQNLLFIRSLKLPISEPDITNISRVIEALTSPNQLATLLKENVRLKEEQRKLAFEIDKYIKTPTTPNELTLHSNTIFQKLPVIPERKNVSIGTKGVSKRRKTM